MEDIDGDSGIVRLPSGTTAQMLSDGRMVRDEGPPSKVEFDKQLISQEEDAWEKVLGKKKITIPPPPAYITHELKEQLGDIGFELRYVPQLNLRRDLINRITSVGYLHIMKMNHYRNWYQLHAWFWDQVKEGRIKFPSLPAQWMAVETNPQAIINATMGINERTNRLWRDIQKRIKHIDSDVLSALGINNTFARLPSAIEYNLLGNREGWGETHMYEWTETSITDNPRPVHHESKLIIGNNSRGGIRHAESRYSNESGSDIGFRVVIPL